VSSGVALGAHASPGRKKKNWAKFTGESCKCTPGRGRVFFGEIGEIWTVGVVNLVALACILRATTKKVVNFFEEEKCTSRRKSWLHLWGVQDFQTILTCQDVLD